MREPRCGFMNTSGVTVGRYTVTSVLFEPHRSCRTICRSFRSHYLPTDLASVLERKTHASRPLCSEREVGSIMASGIGHETACDGRKEIPPKPTSNTIVRLRRRRTISTHDGVLSRLLSPSLRVPIGFTGHRPWRSPRMWGCRTETDGFRERNGRTNDCEGLKSESTLAVQRYCARTWCVLYVHKPANWVRHTVMAPQPPRC
jgi:hypothetical protein